MKGTKDDGSGDTDVYMLESVDHLCGVERQEASKSFVLDRIPRSTQSNFISYEGNRPYFYLGS
jgi:hypothetical protein